MRAFTPRRPSGSITQYLNWTIIPWEPSPARLDGITDVRHGARECELVSVVGLLWAHTHARSWSSRRTLIWNRDQNLVEVDSVCSLISVRERRCAQPVFSSFRFFAFALFFLSTLPAQCVPSHQTLQSSAGEHPTPGRRTPPVLLPLPLSHSTLSSSFSLAGIRMQICVLHSRIRTQPIRFPPDGQKRGGMSGCANPPGSRKLWQGSLRGFAGVAVVTQDARNAGTLVAIHFFSIYRDTNLLTV